MFSQNVSAVLCFLCVGCAAAPRTPHQIVASQPVAEDAGAGRFTAQDHSALMSPSSRRKSGFPWAVSQPLMQGFIGASSFSRVETEDGSVDGDEGDVDELPLIGGGAQWKLGGRGVTFGLEGLLSFAWRANAEAFAIGGGGAVVAVDVDVLLFELYGGPFASLFLGDKLRLYGAVGPLLQFADYEQTGGGLAEDGSGFGAGWYARTGLEFALPSRTLIGFGVRWSDSSVDLDGDLGDLEIEGLQAVVTVSRGL